MRYFLLMIAVVLVGGCHAGNKNMAEKAKAVILIEEAIRKAANKPEGDLTKADYEKLKELDLGDHYLTEVPKGLDKLMQLTRLSLSDNRLTDVKGLENLTQLTNLDLYDNKLTDVKGLEKLTQLEWLYLGNNPDLTKAQIDELQKALPKCRIFSNPTK